MSRFQGLLEEGRDALVEKNFADVAIEEGALGKEFLGGGVGEGDGGGVVDEEECFGEGVEEAFFFLAVLLFLELELLGELELGLLGELEIFA